MHFYERCAKGVELWIGMREQWRGQEHERANFVHAIMIRTAAGRGPAPPFVRIFLKCSVLMLTGRSNFAMASEGGTSCMPAA